MSYILGVGVQKLAPPSVQHGKTITRAFGLADGIFKLHAVHVMLYQTLVLRIAVTIFI